MVFKLRDENKHENMNSNDMGVWLTKLSFLEANCLTKIPIYKAAVVSHVHQEDRTGVNNFSMILFSV